MNDVCIIVAFLALVLFPQIHSASFNLLFGCIMILGKSLSPFSSDVINGGPLSSHHRRAPEHVVRDN